MTQIKIVEVGPRDGLQNESNIIPTAVKVDFVQRLADSGLQFIEAGAFVSPKWVPQLADSAAVFEALDLDGSQHYSALVPNLKGLAAASATGVKEIAVFTAASESFCQKNINCSIDESIDRFSAVMTQAKADNLFVRGYISCALGCPYEGEISIAAVTKVAEQLLDLGVNELSIGDTIGVGNPHHVKQLLQQLTQLTSNDKLAVHFHDTYGQALANIYAALESDIFIIDSSAAGLGGCPYAAGASGNVATEDVVYLCEGLGLKTGVNLNKLVQAGAYITQQLQRPNQSKTALALLAKASN